jgi:hypothetical protein
VEKCEKEDHFYNFGILGANSNSLNRDSLIQPSTIIITQLALMSDIRN